MTIRNTLSAWAAAALLAGIAAAPAQASEARDHDRARRALEAGEILPLRTILDRVEREMPGQVIEVELERDSGRWFYEIKVLRAGGSLVKLKVDARDGTVLGAKQRGADHRDRSGAP
ncbi:MAG: PepSY domain-containing protein [Burkholderiales bacterium]|nr:PepSY domain-containing protein [Burkholderiales bacterium]